MQLGTTVQRLNENYTTTKSSTINEQNRSTNSQMFPPQHSKNRNTCYTNNTQVNSANTKRLTKKNTQINIVKEQNTHQHKTQQRLLTIKFYFNGNINSHRPFTVGMQWNNFKLHQQPQAYRGIICTFNNTVSGPITICRGIVLIHVFINILTSTSTISDYISVLELKYLYQTEIPNCQAV